MKTWVKSAKKYPASTKNRNLWPISQKMCYILESMNDELNEERILHGI